MRTFHQISFSSVDEAVSVYTNALPWERSAETAWMALAALEYIVLVRPIESRLGEAGLSYAAIQSELDRIRKYLNLNDLRGSSSLQRVRTRGVE